MKRIKVTLMFLGLINLAFYGPGIVKEIFKECEKGKTQYSKLMNLQEDGRSITIFKDVTLSQRQIDSLKKIGKIE